MKIAQFANSVDSDTAALSAVFKSYEAHGRMIIKGYVQLTLKAPIPTAADDIHKYFSLFFRENKT